MTTPADDTFDVPGVPSLCNLCNRPATGFATINDLRYCHGDDTPLDQMTCYEQAQSERDWGASSTATPVVPR